ncbi:MAG: hypothetical protein KVP17_004791 [Porospora cf. gigantea B]|uniref:uncharacterized protein n=1 Tax=Porospora cf. gigantea B TaxID=2853592 RepID=UPI003571B8AF|nr:MAG: hypothetical protein KVP17_004791 [Porospora cf. gigantea B]
MQLDLLTLLFSGLVMEVMLRVVPALRLARRRPLLCTSAVQTAIRRLSETVLTIPVDGDDYLLETDASGTAVGAILSVNRGGAWRG